MTRETREKIIERFFEWHALSEQERQDLSLPVTQSDFAITHGVSVALVSRWKKHATVDEIRIKELKDSIYDSAMGKDARMKDRELAARVFQLTAPQNINVNVEMTANDRIRVATDILTELRERYKQDGGVCPVCLRPQILLEKVCVHSDEDETTQDN